MNWEQLLQNNEFFQGGLLLALFGGAIAALRYLPSEIWRILQRYFSTTLYVRDTDLIGWISDWLQETEQKRTNWWMAEIIDRGSDHDEVLVKPGIGLHIVKRFGKSFLIHSELEDNGVAGKIHTYTIKTYGRNPQKIEKLLDEARELAKKREVGKNVLYINSVWGDWDRIKLGEPRPLDTIILREGLLEEIVKDLKNFQASKDKYIKTGMPYRRGYLFEGPPGNGKSSLVRGLATEFCLPIYILNIGDAEFSDSRLAKAIGNVPENSILLLEDADRIDFTKTSVSLSALLNVIDGSLASEGRILIVTANDPSKLDPAFRREGRMDRTWTLNNPDVASIQRMVKRFGNKPVDFVAWSTLAVNEGWSMAKVQGQLQIRERLI